MTVTITEYAREGDFTDLQTYTCAQMGRPTYQFPDSRAKDRYDVIVLDANRQIEVMRGERLMPARSRVDAMITRGIDPSDIQIAHHNQSGIGATRKGHLCSLIDIWPDLIPKAVAAGYIATNSSRTAIFGVGKTEADALSDAIESSDIREAFPHIDPAEAFKVKPATQALLDHVEENGGAYISWGSIDGIACTDAEEEANT